MYWWVFLYAVSPFFESLLLHFVVYYLRGQNLPKGKFSLEQLIPLRREAKRNMRELLPLKMEWSGWMMMPGYPSYSNNSRARAYCAYTTCGGGYSRTSVGRTLMAHLPQLFRTRS